MSRFVLIGSLICAASMQTASAHPGPRVWVNVESGKVTTYTGPYPPGNPADYHRSQVFTQALVDEGGDFWDTDLPGYQQVPGGSIPVGTNFNYNITGPLLWYNPGDAAHCPFFETVEARFSNSPPVPQFAVTNELLQTKITSTGFVSGNKAYAYNGSSGDHNHLTYTLLGDGVNAGGGPDGIYALPLQLTAGGYTASDTYYLLFGKNASAADFTTAASVILAPRVRPDLDCNGVVDSTDLMMFTACRTRTGVPLPVLPPGLEYCVRADFDHDSDVDHSDFGIFQRCYSGTSPPPASCDQ